MRPVKLNEAIIENIEMALNLGATVKIASAYAGVPERTFYHWQKIASELYDHLIEVEEAHEAYKEAKKQAKKDKSPPPDPPEKRPSLTKSDKLLLQLLQVITRAKAEGAVAHLNFLYKAAPHNPSVSMWLLEKRYPEAFGARPTQIQHTGAEGGPILTEDLSGLSVAERATRTHQLLMLAAERKQAEAQEQAQADEGE